MSINESIIEMDAYKKWMQITEADRSMLLSNGFCRNCMVSTFAPGYTLSLEEDGCILITGNCVKCGEPMARLVEREWYDKNSLAYIFEQDDFDDDYEDDYENVNPEFKECIKIFEQWLNASNLSERTKAKHMDNVSFYVLDYLNYYEPCEHIVEGCDSIGLYLGDWFIRKCMWSSRNAIKENATSIKKFYKCMLEYERISKADYEMLCETIKDEKDYWLGRFDRYMDPDYDIEDWLWE